MIKGLKLISRRQTRNVIGKKGETAKRKLKAKHNLLH